MLEDIINVLKDLSLRHKQVKSFKYQNTIYTNAQNNNKYFQVVVDDVNLHQLLISYQPDIFTSTFDIYIIGFVDTTNTILNVQSVAYDIAIQLIKKLDSMDEWKNIIDVHDYSILTLSHYTDDNSAGVKLSLELNIPIGVCDIDEYFEDEPKDMIEEDKDIRLTVDKSGDTDKDINLKPIKLPKNKVNENKCR